jgi:hypothetical protein
MRGSDLATLNSHLHAAGVKAITVPAVNQLHAEGAGDSDDVP